MLCVLTYSQNQMTTHNLQNVRSLAILFHLIGDEGSDADTTYRHWRILHQEYNPTYTEQMYSPLIRILKQLVFPQKQPIPQEGPRILEIGFGNGHLLKFLMNMGACVVGIEKDEKLVSYARKLGLMHVYHSRGPTLEEVEELPREMCNAYFDATIAHRVLEEPVMRRKEIERCIHSINKVLEKVVTFLSEPGGAVPFLCMKLQQTEDLKS